MILFCRFQKLQVLNSNRSLGNSSVAESQAAKRQKLEGGLLHKVHEFVKFPSTHHGFSYFAEFLMEAICVECVGFKS